MRSVTRLSRGVLSSASTQKKFWDCPSLQQAQGQARARYRERSIELDLRSPTVRRYHCTQNTKGAFTRILDPQANNSLPITTDGESRKHKIEVRIGSVPSV